VLLTLLTGMGVVTPQEARVLLSMGSQWRSRPGVAAHQEARQALLAASQKLAQVSQGVREGGSAVPAVSGRGYCKATGPSGPLLQLKLDTAWG
jgi:hypothetical protein